MFSNIANESYDVDFNEFLKIKDTGRRKTVELPMIKYETHRLNFWYRTGFRINVLQKTIEFRSGKSEENTVENYVEVLRHKLENKQSMHMDFYLHLRYMSCQSHDDIKLKGQKVPVAIPRSPFNNNNNIQ